MKVIIKTSNKIKVIHTDKVYSFEFKRCYNLYELIVCYSEKYASYRHPEFKHDPTRGYAPADDFNLFYYEDVEGIERWYVEPEEIEKLVNCKEEVVLNALETIEVKEIRIIKCKNKNCGYILKWESNEELEKAPKSDLKWILNRKCPHCWHEIQFTGFLVKKDKTAC